MRWDLSNPVIESAQLTSGQLVAEARDRGIDQLRSEGEFMWFGSMPDDLGKAFSLYVHDIDGREPTSDDCQQIADMLGVELEGELDGLADVLAVGPAHEADGREGQAPKLSATFLRTSPLCHHTSGFSPPLPSAPMSSAR